MALSLPLLLWLVKTFASSLATSHGRSQCRPKSFRKVPVLEGDWNPLTDLPSNISALTKSLGTCPKACLMMGDQCSGYRMHASNNTCTMGTLNTSVEYISEFEENGTMEVMIKKEKVDKVMVPHLFSSREDMQSIVLPKHSRVPKTEIEVAPRWHWWGIEASLIQPYKKGVIKCGGLAHENRTILNLPVKECWAYSFATKELTSLSPMTYGHAFGGGIHFRGKYWVFGGESDGDPEVGVLVDFTPDRHVEVYHPGEDRWEDAGLLPVGILTPSLVGISKNEILVVGGTLKHMEFLDTSREFNVETKTFGMEKKIPVEIQVQIFHCSLHSPINSVVCAGGAAPTGEDQRGVCLYDLVDRIWSCPGEMRLPVGDSGGFHAIGRRLLFAGFWSKKLHEFHGDGIPDYWEEVADVPEVGLVHHFTYNVMYTHFLK